MIRGAQRGRRYMAVSFKGGHFPKEIMALTAVVASAGSPIGPRVYRHATAVLLQLVMAALCIVNSPSGSQAAEATQTPPTMEERVWGLMPALEAYIASGMKAFDVP